jgi:Clp amino terminal domain, pathogenicity island component
MALDEKILEEARDLRERLLDLQHEEERARVDYQHAIRRLHAKGGSLREIADELGLSHQRVHQIVGEEDLSAPAPATGTAMQFLGGPRRGRAVGRGRRPFERFTREARRVVTVAQHEAKELGHAWIGTEHLLLGVLGIEESLAARALGEFEITLEGARDDVKRTIGEGDEPAPKRRRGPRMPFTPKAKKVLELSLRIARKLKDDHIGGEHILLALFEEREGAASQILRERGVKEKELRRCIEALRGEN